MEVGRFIMTRDKSEHSCPQTNNELNCDSGDSCRIKYQFLEGVEMKTSAIAFAIAVIMLSTLCSCAGVARQRSQPPNTIVLANGERIKLVAWHHVYGAGGKEFVVLDYETTLSIHDVRALHKQALGVWNGWFRNLAERAGYNEAIVRAVTPPSGPFNVRLNYGFGFKKVSGRWSEIHK